MIQTRNSLMRHRVGLEDWHGAPSGSTSTSALGCLAPGGSLELPSSGLRNRALSALSYPGRERAACIPHGSKRGGCRETGGRPSPQGRQGTQSAEIPHSGFGSATLTGKVVPKPIFDSTDPAAPTAGSLSFRVTHVGVMRGRGVGDCGSRPLSSSRYALRSRGRVRRAWPRSRPASCRRRRSPTSPSRSSPAVVPAA